MRTLNKALFFSLLPLSLAASSPTDWYEPTVENRPFVRWWWLGSAVDPEGLTYNLSEFARQGLGGVEITPIYGVKGNESNDIPYLSDKWMDMLRHTTAESKRLGLQVDMNNGTGWPFGGPEVTTEESARKQIIEKWTLPGGHRHDIAIAPSDAKQQPVANLQKVIAVRGDKRLDITDSVKDGRLDWKAPAGDDWTIYALFNGRTFQKVKRAAPGGEGYVVNHYDSLAVKKYLDRFDRAFKGREDIIPNTFFNDSYEVYGSDWTEGLLDQFEAENGYRLEKYLPEFADYDNDSELRARVVSDYRRTLGNMLKTHFTDVWTEWAHSHGARIRNQSHGSPANIIDLYAEVDIPECESFGTPDFDIPGLHRSGPTRPNDAEPIVLKLASSAAHLAGKPLTSAEALTWYTEHFHTSLSWAKPMIDMMIAAGVNHIYFHGAPYSPKGVEFPGWMFYASVNMSPTNSFWDNASGFFNYISKAQAFATAGSPDADFLLYFPYDDIIHRQSGRPYMMFAIHNMHKSMPDVKDAGNAVVDAGYDMDFVSDSLLSVLSVRPDGTISSKGDTHHKAIIVPGVKMMQPQTMRRLLSLAKDGATVIFTGNIPSDVPGLGHLDERRKALKDASSSLKPWADGLSYSLGKGKIIYAPTVRDALALSGVKPEPARAGGLSMMRRRNDEGGYNYFMTLLTNNPIDGPVQLATPAKSAIIYNPLTGVRGMAEVGVGTEGNATVRLQMRPGETLMVKTLPDVVEGETWQYISHRGEPIDINSGWLLSFPKSDPEVADTFAIDTVIPWTSLPDPRMQVNSATGRYEVEFTLPDIPEAANWELSLADLRESARIMVNGNDAGTIWAVPFTLNIGKYLKPGVNRLTIDVTNLQANRIRDYEKRGVEWRKFKDANIASVTNAKTFSFGDWDVTPSGLNSHVTITPIYY
ncbi:MAG: glycosyl hydrolase family 2 [Muribaculaceae bacterium]|nr:glycosyl hydrolase family 2 [Muribaculaceae bacterium]